MSIEIVTFKITGTSPMLQHNPSAMAPQNGGVKKATKIPTAEEEAEAGLYRMSDGNLYFPSIAFRSALLSSGVGKKIGKQTAWKMVACGVFTMEPECPLFSAKNGKPLKTYTKINVARAVLKKCGAVIRCRPELQDWACKLPLEIEDDFITPSMVLELLTLSGRIIGVGDWRPERKGPYGRFTVEMVK